MLDRVRRVLPAVWAGVLLCLALMATPAPFAVLERADAGRVVGRIFAQEAWLALVLPVLLLVLERGRAKAAAALGDGSALSTDMLLVLATVFCTVAGYFAIQPLLPAARAGQGGLSFGQLHAISTMFFGLKTLLVLVLAWRGTRPTALIATRR